MQRRKVLSIGGASATMLVEDDEGLKVLKRINVTGWGRDECQNATDMYGLLSRKHDLSPARNSRSRSTRGNEHSSPFSLDVLNVNMQNSFINVICEYAAEGELYSFMAGQREPFGNDAVMRWAHNTALGLAELHELGYSHRNISTKTIFLEPDGCVRIGIPKAHKAYMAKYENTVNAPGFGDDGASPMSSSQLFPPEVVVSGLFLGMHSDVWHWAVTMKELLAFARGGDWRTNRNQGFVQLLEEAMVDDADCRPSLNDIIAVLEGLRGMKQPAPANPPRPSTRHTEQLSAKKQTSPISRRRQHQESSDNSSSPPRHCGEEWNARASMQFDALQEMQRRAQSQHQEGRRTATRLSMRHHADPNVGSSNDDLEGMQHRHRSDDMMEQSAGASGSNTYERYDPQHDPVDPEGHVEEFDRGYNATSRGGDEPTSPLQSTMKGTRKSNNIAAMQHTLRNMPKHQRMDAMRELSEMQQTQQDVRRKEQAEKKLKKEQERLEAEHRHKEHMEKMRRIKASRSTIKANPTPAPAVAGGATEENPGVMSKDGVQIFVKNPATLDLSATEAPPRSIAEDRKRFRQKQKAAQEEAEDVVNYVVENPKDHQRRQHFKQQQQEVEAHHHHHHVVHTNKQPREPSPDHYSPQRLPPPQPTQHRVYEEPVEDDHFDHVEYNPTTEPASRASRRTGSNGRHSQQAMLEVGDMGRLSVPEDSPPRRAEDGVRYSQREEYYRPSQAVPAQHQLVDEEVEEPEEQRHVRSSAPHVVSSNKQPSPAAPPFLPDASFGMVAIVECNIDVLKNSLAREMDPVQLDDCLVIVEAFAQLSSEDRALPYRNKQLVNKIRDAIGDAELVPAVLPMMLQLVSLESSLRAWRDMGLDGQ